MEGLVIGVVEVVGTIHRGAAQIDNIVTLDHKTHVLQTDLEGVLIAIIVQCGHDLPMLEILRRDQRQQVTGVVGILPVVYVATDGVVSAGHLVVADHKLRFVAGEVNEPIIYERRLGIIEIHAQDITFSDVAQYCHLSEKQLSRLFAAANNGTVAQYIRSQRVGRIEQMLIEGQLTIKEISERMNFTDEHYFNAFFKKHAGMTPGKYRRMQR